jgi:surfeit locus 1 family protein
MQIKLLFSRRWIVSTILAVGAVGVMVRLGIWQLDRLSQRREFNARVEKQLDEDTLLLDADKLDLDLYSMEYRTVEVRGEYEYSKEVVLLNRYWRERLGVDILTPLRIANTDQYVLIDRGWVPQEDYRNGDLAQYQVSGQQLVRGRLRRGESYPTFGGAADPTLAPGQERLEQWNVVNVDRIAEENGHNLLPVYIQEENDANDNEPPIPGESSLDLTEGPHLGYAIQWFTFATILLVGYPIFVNKTETTPAGQEEGHRGA